MFSGAQARRSPPFRGSSSAALLRCVIAHGSAERSRRLGRGAVCLRCTFLPPLCSVMTLTHASCFVSACISLTPSPLPPPPPPHSLGAPHAAPHHRQTSPNFVHSSAEVRKTPIYHHQPLHIHIPPPPNPPPLFPQAV